MVIVHQGQVEEGLFPLGIFRRLRRFWNDIEDHFFAEDAGDPPTDRADALRLEIPVGIKANGRHHQ